ncbi:hypothetical protein L2E82_31292 [Cichorium intybus]|uniref:Uncharacterized protein n=1 Tax=Cichorium intybus TaxID=13427 RepID=A0ACB9D2X8_CICIN|nr:hypothetical protein L2E82_31292 [Cichorium intybus]
MTQLNCFVNPEIRRVGDILDILCLVKHFDKYPNKKVRTERSLQQGNRRENRDETEKNREISSLVKVVNGIVKAEMKEEEASDLDLGFPL